jgi:nucleoside-diphosphate-sugar epimerase
MIDVNNKVIISGSAGFIGFHLAKKLINMGLEVIGVDSLNDAYDVRLKNLRLSELSNYKNYEFCELDLSNANIKHTSTNFLSYGSSRRCEAELFRALRLCTRQYSCNDKRCQFL